MSFAFYKCWVAYCFLAAFVNLESQAPQRRGLFFLRWYNASIILGIEGYLDLYNGYLESNGLKKFKSLSLTFQVPHNLSPSFPEPHLLPSLTCLLYSGHTKLYPFLSHATLHFMV